MMKHILIVIAIFAFYSYSENTVSATITKKARATDIVELERDDEIYQLKQDVELIQKKIKMQSSIKVNLESQIKSQGAMINHNNIKINNMLEIINRIEAKVVSLNDALNQNSTLLANAQLQISEYIYRSRQNTYNLENKIISNETKTTFNFRLFLSILFALVMIFTIFIYHSRRLFLPDDNGIEQQVRKLKSDFKEKSFSLDTNHG